MIIQATNKDSNAPKTNEANNKNVNKTAEQLDGAEKRDEEPLTDKNADKAADLKADVCSDGEKQATGGNPQKTRKSRPFLRQARGNGCNSRQNNPAAVKVFMTEV